MYHRTICRFVCLSLLSIVLSQAVFPRQSKNYKTLTTANFQFMHEKRIKQDDVRRLGETFENQYVYYQKKFNLSYAQKPKVFILNSSDRLRSESKSRVYNDAAYADGRLYVSLPQVRGKDGQGEIARIVAQSLLSRIVLCPAWLVETYAIHAGGDYKRFGKPAQVTGSSFTDLSEDYSRIDEAGNAQQIYALLAATAKFFVDHYGEDKFESVFKQFKKGSSLEDAFEKSFGEKMADIEHAWGIFVRSQVRG